MAKPPVKRSNQLQVGEFLAKAGELTVKARKVDGRLLFAIDATASRQPTWDRACHLQSQMFRAVDSVGGLAIQLCYFRGFEEFKASPWCYDSQSLLRQMNGVYCEGGYTQIEKLLSHAVRECRNSKVNAVVFIGDAVEESADKLSALAGQLGMLKCPLFLFQEGSDPEVARVFGQMARLSGGVYHAFNESSARELGDLLSAVAVYAAGGKTALRESRKLESSAVKALLQQLS